MKCCGVNRENLGVENCKCAICNSAMHRACGVVLVLEKLGFDGWSYFRYCCSIACLRVETSGAYYGAGKKSMKRYIDLEDSELDRRVAMYKLMDSAKFENRWVKIAALVQREATMVVKEKMLEENREVETEKAVEWKGFDVKMKVDGLLRLINIVFQGAVFDELKNLMQENGKECTSWTGLRFFNNIAVVCNTLQSNDTVNKVQFEEELWNGVHPEEAVKASGEEWRRIWMQMWNAYLNYGFDKHCSAGLYKAKSGPDISLLVPIVYLAKWIELKKKQGAGVLGNPFEHFNKNSTRKRKKRVSGKSPIELKKVARSTNKEFPNMIPENNVLLSNDTEMEDFMTIDLAAQLLDDEDSTTLQLMDTDSSKNNQMIDKANEPQTEPSILNSPILMSLPETTPDDFFRDLETSPPKDKTKNSDSSDSYCTTESIESSVENPIKNHKSSKEATPIDPRRASRTTKHENIAAEKQKLAAELESLKRLVAQKHADKVKATQEQEKSIQSAILLAINQRAAQEKAKKQGKKDLPPSAPPKPQKPLVPLSPIDDCTDPGSSSLAETLQLAKKNFEKQEAARLEQINQELSFAQYESKRKESQQRILKKRRAQNHANMTQKDKNSSKPNNLQRDSSTTTSKSRNTVQRVVPIENSNQDVSVRKPKPVEKQQVSNDIDARLQKARQNEELRRVQEEKKAKKRQEEYINYNESRIAKAKARELMKKKEMDEVAARRQLAEKETIAKKAKDVQLREHAKAELELTQLQKENKLAQNKENELKARQEVQRRKRFEENELRAKMLYEAKVVEKEIALERKLAEEVQSRRQKDKTPKKKRHQESTSSKRNEAKAPLNLQDNVDSRKCNDIEERKRLEAESLVREKEKQLQLIRDRQIRSEQASKAKPTVNNQVLQKSTNNGSKANESRKKQNKMTHSFTDDKAAKPSDVRQSEVLHTSPKQNIPASIRPITINLSDDVEEGELPICQTTVNDKGNDHENGAIPTNNAPSEPNMMDVEPIEGQNVVRKNAVERTSLTPSEKENVPKPMPIANKIEKISVSTKAVEANSSVHIDLSEAGLHQTELNLKLLEIKLAAKSKLLKMIKMDLESGEDVEENEKLLSQVRKSISGIKQSICEL